MVNPSAASRSWSLRLTRLDLGLVLAILLTGFLLASLETAGQERLRQKKETHGTFLQPEETAAPRTPLQKLAVDRQELEQKVFKNPVLKRRLTWVSTAISLVLLTSLIAILRLFWRAFQQKPLFSSLGRPAVPTWNLRQILRLILILLLFSQWIFLVEGFLFFLFKPVWLDKHVVSLLNTVLVDFGAVTGFLWIVSRGRKGRKVSFPGALRVFPLSRFWKKLRFGLGTYVTLLPVFVMLVLAATLVLEKLGHETRPQPIFQMFLAEDRTLVLTILLFLVAVAGPIAEELFFRGLLYGWLRRKIGIQQALVVSGLIFAGMHTDLQAFLPIWGLGVLFAWIYERTGSLVTPMAVHITHNAGMMLLAFVFKSVMNG